MDLDLIGMTAVSISAIWPMAQIGYAPHPRSGARRDNRRSGALMKPTSESSTQEVLAGLVERVTFHNAESGFCVLRRRRAGTAIW